MATSSKSKEQYIRDFSLGISTDPRSPDLRYSQLTQNFDALTYPHKLVPFRDSESGDSSASTSQKVNFLYANSRLYGLGVVNGTAKAEINYKTDFTNALWTGPSGNASSAGSKSDGLFVHYKNYIYGARAGTSFWRHGDITGTPSWSDSWQSVSYTNIAQGLVHSKDDILYIPYDNKIASWDNSTFTSAALTLPSDKIITSICEYGNYLAIGCRPSTGQGKSVVYLWDRDSSLTTISESIDFGEGNLQILEEIEGYLIGISYSSTNSFVARITFRAWNGGQEAAVFKRLVSEAQYVAGDLPIAKQKIGSALYFLLTITLNGTKLQGLWKIARVSQTLPFSVVMDRTPNNDTALTSGSLNGFFILGDYVFISYISSSTYALSKTNDQASYAVTAVHETVIINDGDPSLTKKLLGVSVTHEALPSGGQIVLKYKKDEETSFTTILTSSTANALSKSSTVIESSNATLPEYKEITLRTESYGGAVLTGISYLPELVNNRPY